MTLPNTLADIQLKVRKITARPSQTQITDAQINQYINTFYIYDMPEHIKMESLRYNYQFTTTANIPVYDFPTDLYLTDMPPVFIGGYQSFMTQSRESFFRINPELNFLQQIYTGNGTAGPYTGQFCINTPITPGFKPNPPGAYAGWTSANDMAPQFLNWNVIVSALGTPNSTSGIAPSMTLVDDGGGNLFNVDATTINPTTALGNINYITGALTVTFPSAVPAGNEINVQYVPYVASRPQSVVFFQDQMNLYPIPDQAYTVSFEAYKYPTELISAGQSPQLNEWWQMLAYGAADKIFSDNGDFENQAKYRPLLEEQMALCLRRSIVQQTSERTATIYTEQTQFPQYPFGNLFSGF
jgi:hypothetical protein